MLILRRFAAIGLLALALPAIAVAAATHSQSGQQSAAAIAALPNCQASALVVSIDGENGAYSGMQHSGGLLVVRNIGADACRLSRLPKLVFADSQGRSLPVTRSAPPGMHPGPVVTPVGIAVGAEVTADLRWISGDAYGAGNCVTAASIQMQVDGQPVGMAFGGHFCGPAGDTLHFTQGSLEPDAVIGGSSTEAGRSLAAPS